jgi:hypothetical protein
VCDFFGVKLFVFFKSLEICVVVSDFLGLNFCVFLFQEFKNLCVCDVLGVKKLLVIITRICMYVIFFGGGQIACDFQKFKNLCVIDFLGLSCLCFSGG